METSLSGIITEMHDYESRVLLGTGLRFAGADKSAVAKVGDEACGLLQAFPLDREGDGIFLPCCAVEDVLFLMPFLKSRCSQIRVEGPLFLTDVDSSTPSFRVTLHAFEGAQTMLVISPHPDHWPVCALQERVDEFLADIPTRSVLYRSEKALQVPDLDPDEFMAETAYTEEEGPVLFKQCWHQT